jgi:4-hydroxy-3-methylbut-2-en-1-yl diphosphate reductase
MTRLARTGGVTGTPSARIREVLASGLTIRVGEVLVPTQLGDARSGPISCAAAPLVAGSLQRRAQELRLAPVPQYRDAGPDGDAVLYLATCPQPGGGSTAIAAAAAVGDRLSAAFALAAVEEWAAVAGSRVLLAGGSPWCGGALRAADMCRQATADHAARGQAVRILGPQSLPAETTAELEALGAVPVTSLADAQEGDVVVFPAHGVSSAVRTEAAERGLVVIDATCPLVAKAQDTAGRLADRGQHVVLIGQGSAAAAEPITSRASGQVTLVENAAGTIGLNVVDAQRISYLLQPGLPVEAAGGAVAALRSRYPAAQGTPPLDLCYAPSDRVGTVRMIAAGSDFVLVLGDPESADARQLVSQARDAGARVQPVGAVFDLAPSMLDGVVSVGLIESTSAPAGLAAQVIAAVGGLGRLKVARRQVRTQVPASGAAADDRAGSSRWRGRAEPGPAYRQSPALTKTGYTGTRMASTPG